jgi:hypothetical protein
MGRVVVWKRVQIDRSGAYQQNETHDIIRIGLSSVRVWLIEGRVVSTTRRIDAFI